MRRTFYDKWRSFKNSSFVEFFEFWKFYFSFFLSCFFPPILYFKFPCSSEFLDIYDLAIN